MSNAKLTVIRHGETEWNVAMRLQGKQDSLLTKRGLVQVQKTAMALAKREFDVLFSSDLGRAKKTAEEINTFQKLEICFAESLRERNFGIMEGLTREEIDVKYPGTFESYMNRLDTFQIPEGESLVQFDKRVMEGLNKIADENLGKSILIVSHGGVLDCLLREVFHYPVGNRRVFSIYNAAINTFTVQLGIWKLEEWGNIDHLDDIETRDELK